MVHVIYDLSRHAGHSDIMREQLDGATGWQEGNTNVPGVFDWASYTDKLTGLADKFAER